MQATHVLDPTLLLTVDDYKKLLGQPEKPSKILFAFILDTSAEKVGFLKKVADKFGLELFIKGANDDLQREDSIEGWLSDIRDAAMVVTDSFHGSVFAIHFHRPFLSIVNNKRGADRFTSLLGKLGLMDRLVNETTNIDGITNTIDWEAVEEKLNAERNLSFGFIKNAL